jgi:ATP-dependent exoDNAse (exonuclease V) beta subunit
VGQCDLIVVKADGEHWVVDYKTTKADTQDLTLYSKAQGYHQQVAGYMNIWQRIAGANKVRGFVWFIAHNALIEVY